jgi:hypothetical protein
MKSAAIGVCLIAFACGAWAQSQQTPNQVQPLCPEKKGFSAEGPTQERKQSQESKNCGAETQNLGQITINIQGKPVGTQKDAEQSTDYEKENLQIQREGLNANEKLSNLTLGLLFVTALLAIAAFGQLTVGQRNSKHELRAYTFFEKLEQKPITLGSAPTQTTEWRTHVVWKNSGKTPSIRTRVYANYLATKTRIDPLTEDWRRIDQSGAITDRSPLGERVPTIAPGGTAPTYCGSFPLQMLEDMREDQGAPNGYLYIWGWVDYDDVFRGSLGCRKRHRHEFFGRLVSDGPASATDHMKYSFRIFGPHNGTEEESSNDPKPYKKAD